jgi:cystathionine gamma-synthase
LNARQAKRQFNVAFVDQGDQAVLEMALARSPKLILVETSIAACAKEAGAKVVVDKRLMPAIG